MTTVAETLEYLLKSISPDPQNISVESTDDNGLVVLTINAPTDVIGQIIGKEGRIIKAIRLLLTVAHPQVRFHIDFKE